MSYKLTLSQMFAAIFKSKGVYDLNHCNCVSSGSPLMYTIVKCLDPVFLPVLITTSTKLRRRPHKKPLRDDMSHDPTSFHDMIKLLLF